MGAPVVYPVLKPNQAVFRDFFKAPFTYSEGLAAAEGDPERDYYAFINGDHLGNFEAASSSSPGTPPSFGSIESVTEFVKRFIGAVPSSPGRMVDAETAAGFGLPMKVVRGSAMAKALKNELAVF
jgi:hypothetical protein